MPLVLLWLRSSAFVSGRFCSLGSLPLRRWALLILILILRHIIHVSLERPLLCFPLGPQHAQPRLVEMALQRWDIGVRLAIYMRDERTFEE